MHQAHKHHAVKIYHNAAPFWFLSVYHPDVSLKPIHIRQSNASGRRWAWKMYTYMSTLWDRNWVVTSDMIASKTTEDDTLHCSGRRHHVEGGMPQTHVYCTHFQMSHKFCMHMYMACIAITIAECFDGSWCFNSFIFGESRFTTNIVPSYSLAEVFTFWCLFFPQTLPYCLRWCYSLYELYNTCGRCAVVEKAWWDGLHLFSRNGHELSTTVLPVQVPWEVYWVTRSVMIWHWHLL